MKQKMTILTLDVMLLFSSLPMTAFAASDNAGAAVGDNDYSNPSDPFVATSFEDLQAFVNQNRFTGINPPQRSDKTYYVRLGADISYSGYDQIKLATNGPYFQSSYVVTPVTVIDWLNVTISKPKSAGQIPYDASVPGYADYEISDYSDNYWHSGVRWRKVSGKSILDIPYSESSFFQEDTKYRLDVLIRSKDADQFRFADGDTLRAAVNGSYAEVTDNHDGTCTVSYIFHMPWLVKDIDLFITEPESGNPITYDASTPNPSHFEIKKDNNLSGGVLYGVQWKRGSETLDPTQTNIFESGNSYTVAISIRIKDTSRYAFAQSGLCNATLNGSKADILRITDDNYVVFYTYAFTAEIESVEVSIPEPQAGDPITYQAAVPDGMGYKVRDYDNDNYKDGVWWKKNGDTLDPQEDFCFEAGASYSVSILINVTDASLFRFPEMKIPAYVNNGCAVYRRLSDTRCMVGYTFTVEDTCIVSIYLDAAASEPIAGVEVERGSVFGPVAEPGREGEVFMGWYTDRALTKPYDPTQPIWENTELFPRWEKKTLLIGDVDLDGIITISDVTVIQLHAAELITLSGDALPAADTNGDGKVDVNDATHLQKYIAEYDVVLGKQTD